MAELRGWDRLLAWRALPGARDRLHALKVLLKLPLRAPRDAVRRTRDIGDAVTAQSGVPRHRQIRQLWWLLLRHGLERDTYLDYRLYRPERWRRAAHFVGEMEFVRLANFLKLHKWPEDRMILWHRRRFEAFCREHALPTVSTLLEITDGEISFAADPADPVPHLDLFSKPTESKQGEGARRWMYDGAGRWTGGDGRPRNAAELLDELGAASLVPDPRTGIRRPILVKRCVSNHAALTDLTPGGLCTIRIQTYRFPCGAPELLFGAYRMPQGDAPADNFHFGGLAAPIDAGSGRLGRAIFRRGRLIDDTDRHPDTGALIEGREIPRWSEAVELALRAHALLPAIGFVGWDVAILDDGPVLIEGNTVPGPDVAQAPSGIPLGHTPFVRCINAHMREHFGLEPESGARQG